MSEQNQKRDLILAPGEYAYMQDTTKGVIKTYTGPTVINPTAQERTIVYNEATKSFETATRLEDAMRRAPIAPEGFYIILLNAAKGGKHPDEGSAQPSAELEIGRKVNIPGPATFALWPGQTADVVRGHHLHNNQFLIVRVYNEEEAKKNWTSAVIKPATQTDGADTTTQITSVPPPDLTVGKQLIIRGTEVSFYIPPTGIGVVTDQDGGYVREALTLERLEYCILVDEDGNKRYEKGPQVVFPRPSERFIEDKGDGRGPPSKKFRAIELNLIQGLHIKVIAPYEENGKKYEEGDELFITGKDTAIYYPREEHSAIKYDGKAKHFATAIPAGEARYLMNRLTGEIKTVKGPAMLLPDPRTEVIVRRVLSEKQASLWYPGNGEVAAYNRELRTIASNVPTTRQGAVSEGDFERNSRGVTRGGGGTKALKSSGSLGAMEANASYASYNSVMESSRVSGDQALVGEEFSRASSYTSPRTVTLDTKYQGAPGIDIWTGYAVMVVSKTGHRHVEKGPKTVLLEYDEALEVLELSMGKPKTTDQTLKTVYLRVDNNKVSDIIEVETVDHVKIQLYLSYLVNFEGDANNWFSVENYVKFLCDHSRSVLRGAVRKLKAEDFYTNATDIIRDTILGKASEVKRPGMLFKENGMRVGDVEVLRVHLMDDRIRKLLDDSQHEVVRSNIDLSNLNRNLSFLKEKENLSREEVKTLTETKLIKDKLALDQAASSLTVILAQLENELSQFEAKQKIEEANRQAMDEAHGAQLDRMAAEKQLHLQVAKQEAETKIELLRAEAEAVVSRFTAVKEGFAEALVALSNKDTLEKVAQAWSINRVIGGDSISDALRRTFTGSPLEPFIEKVVNVAAANGRSSSSSLASPSLT